jgi:hypothetical protein
MITIGANAQVLPPGSVVPPSLVKTINITVQQIAPIPSAATA